MEELNTETKATAVDNSKGKGSSIESDISNINSLLRRKHILSCTARILSKKLVEANVITVHWVKTVQARLVNNCWNELERLK